MRLDGRKDFQFVKSAGSVLHAELKARILRPTLEEQEKGLKRTHNIADLRQV